MTRVLGVDLGARRIGLALSDSLGITASPLAVLERGRDHAADHRAIVDLAHAEGAARIVVGLPRLLSARPGPAETAALTEIEELRSVAGPDLPVEAFDERFTTVIAERGLVDAGVRRQRRKQVVDKVAAAVMLGSYLESRR